MCILKRFLFKQKNPERSRAGFIYIWGGGSFLWGYGGFFISVLNREDVDIEKYFPFLKAFGQSMRYEIDPRK